MMLRGTPAQYPNLTTFLLDRGQRMSERNRRIGLIGGLSGAGLGMLGGAIGVLGGTGMIPQTSILPLVLGGLVTSALAVGGFVAYDLRTRPKLDTFGKEAKLAVEKLLMSLNRKRLHRELDPAAGSLLEETALHWNRVHAALSGPFWADDNLADHWSRVKDQALGAADRAMDEIVVLLSNALRPDNSPAWQRIVEEVASTYLGAEVERQSANLPAGFAPARAIADKLRSLGDEVERLATKAQSESVNVYQTSGGALDLCLSEIRTIEQAETELRRQVGQ